MAAMAETATPVDAPAAEAAGGALEAILELQAAGDAAAAADDRAGAIRAYTAASKLLPELADPDDSEDEAPPGCDKRSYQRHRLKRRKPRRGRRGCEHRLPWTQMT